MVSRFSYTNTSPTEDQVVNHLLLRTWMWVHSLASSSVICYRQAKVGQVSLRVIRFVPSRV
jgi:hypothetical protein